MSIALRIVRPVVLVLACAGPAGGGIRPEFEMDHDPEIHVPATVKVFSQRLKPLWLQALARPEADMQRMAADAIGRAHRAGCPGMEEAVSGLVGVLTAPTTHPAARLAAARALVLLEAKDTSPQMAASAEKYGSDLRQIVEPVLAEWNYEPSRAVWQARLTGAEVRHRDLLLAIRGLGAVDDGPSLKALLALVHDRFRPWDVRKEAAHGVGRMRPSGLEGDARQLMAGGEGASLVDRLCAAELLLRHAGADAQNLLAALAVDREPSVAAVALTRLIEIDPHLALPLAERSMESADAKVRQRGADAYVLRPDPQRVVVLARLLDDPHPAVRGSVRDSLYELAQRPELEESIRQAAMGMLAGDRWRGLEQAALLLGALDNKPSAGRLLELLEYDRPEVGIAAAWGLKNLAIPETLSPMFDKARRNTALRRSRPAPQGLDDQTAHLLEAFGRMKYSPSEALLAEHIPKGLDLGIRSRAAAVWSLGLLHAGVPDEDLAEKLMARIADDGGPFEPPELDGVKQASAASIARMKAISQAVPMRRYYDSKGDANQVTMSLLRALIDVTGEAVPELPPPAKGMGNWFLLSLDD